MLSRFSLIVLLIFCSVLYSADLTNVKVLFDAAHAQGAGNSDWFINTSYSDWHDELVSSGAEVNATQFWDRRVFLEFDVLVIPEPQIPFNDNEKDIILEFVRNGKGVFFIANGSGIDTDEDGNDCPAVLNQVLPQFGLKCDSVNYKGNPLDTTTRSDAPFVSGEERISCWGAASFSGTNLKKAVVTDDNMVFLGYAETENGRIALCADSDVFADGSGTPGDKLYNDYKLGTHKQLSLNIVEWLSGKEGNSGNDDDSVYEPYYQELSGLSGSAFRSALRNLIDDHRYFGYTSAREIMFADLDNVSGKVRSVYNSLIVSCSGIPNNTLMNCEHTWPQSKFTSSESGPKKTDLYHIYPCCSRENSRRSNNPFGDVESVMFEDEDGTLGDDTQGNRVYEPPDRHKGNVARSMFYFSVRYGQAIDSNQEKVLRSWMKIDPVDAAEKDRNNKIASLQQNRNPFIDHPEFVNKISDF